MGIFKTNNSDRAFTLIELIVVMAIIAILVLLAAPRFLGYTKDAEVTAVLQDAKILSDVSEFHHVKSEMWPVKKDASGNLLTHGTGGVDYNIPGLAGTTLYKLDESKLSENIKSIKGNYDDYTLVTDGEYEGAIFSLEAIEDKDGHPVHSDKTPKSYVSKDGIDLTTAPGPKKLIAGDYTAGFFGEVSTGNLITGLELANQIGLTAGTPHNNTEPWLKFVIDGNVIFKSKKSYRYNLGWTPINKAGAVFGDKVIGIRNNNYRVRLMGGLNPNIKNPKKVTSQRGEMNHNSEWNRLILPLHEKSANNNWANPDNVANNNLSWGLNYSDFDLGLTTTNGWTHWTKDETSHGHIGRGDGSTGVEFSSATTSETWNTRGWSPVLEWTESN